MTIKLLVAIQGSGGVEIPAGTEVTLSDAVEAAHVSANKAVYTTRPNTFDATHSSGLWAKVDPVTGMVEEKVSNGIILPARKLSLNTVIPFGHSRVNSWTTTSTPSVHLYQYDNSFWTWCMANFGGSVDMLNDAGVAGNTTAQMKSRVKSDVIEYKPAHVVFMGFINDVLTNVSEDLTKNNCLSMFKQILGCGAQLHCVSDYPCGSGYSGWDAEKSAKLVRLNRWLFDLCSITPGMNFIDGYAEVVDPSTGDAKSSMIHTDLLHSNIVLAKKLGDTVAAGISKCLRSSNSPLISSSIDYVGNDPLSKQIILNGLMLGSGGTGGVGGPVPTGWAAGVTGTGSVITSTSVVARSDGVGNNARITGTFGATEGSLRFDQNVSTSNISTSGGTYQLVGSVGLSGMTGVTKLEVYFMVTMDGVSYVTDAISFSSRAFPQNDFSYVFKSRKLVIPSGSSVSQSQCRARVYGVSGGATMDFGRVSVR